MRIGKTDLNNQYALGIPDNEKADGSSFEELIQSKGLISNSDMMYYLQLQVAIMKESREYEAISNVMKAKHDAATSAIRNMR